MACSRCENGCQLCVVGLPSSVAIALSMGADAGLSLAAQVEIASGLDAALAQSSWRSLKDDPPTQELLQSTDVLVRRQWNTHGTVARRLYNYKRQKTVEETMRDMADIFASGNHRAQPKPPPVPEKDEHKAPRDGFVVLEMIEICCKCFRGMPRGTFARKLGKAPFTFYVHYYETECGKS